MVANRPLDAGVLLWPLPLLCALLPVLAVHLAWWLSVRDGYVPGCLPYLDGCTSISRAARHGLGNEVFRFVMLPCATLQALLWFAAGRWFRRRGWRGAAVLPWLGLTAALFLMLYATFLGTEGEVYRLLRRYGVTVYFGATFLAQALVLRALHPGARGMLVVCAGMLLLGVASTVASATVTDPGFKDRVENFLEWHLGVLLTAWFLLLAGKWRRERLRADFGDRS